MSSVLMTRLSDGIQVFTDGGHYQFSEHHNNYVLTGARSKTHPIPHLSAVFASVGTGDFLPNLIWNCEEHWPSFDALVTSLPADMEATYDHLQRVWGGSRSIMIVVYIGGYSIERARWETYSIFCDRDGTVAPLEAMPATCLTPAPDAKSLAEVGLATDEAGSIHLNGQRDIMLLVQAQRLTMVPMGSRENPPEGHTLGAHVQRTIVRREFVTSEIIHRWDDALGEPIKPKGGEIDAIRQKFSEEKM